ncbi:nuclear envelope pore membrane protein POM 121 [Centroberyx gerrardi]|uniref:nuclear envelope pore membrane protein POM 121 n=1 Tax=Centroberyx gerrardi TaxID=166262 RepID=UPI003AAFD0F4
MRVLRRRAAAMSPREKHLVLLSALGVVSLALYYIPTFLYATLIIAICCIACYYHNGESLPARLGLNPRPGLTVPGVLRRWLWGRRVTGVSVSSPGSRSNKTEESVGHSRQRLCETGIYRREALASESFLFSPRDFLMGSYIGKAESPPAGSGRPRAGRSLGPNPREQLRERLSRPNHAVYTPNRRLSFTGEPLGAVGRFTITPQRHYPLQQPGISSVGVLPPAQWDGFRKKNVLSPRNFPAILSPVTIKIARLDHSTPRSPLLDHPSCAGGPRTPADPCSRETVLKVLKERRKREVEDDERSFTAEQKSKRRRSDSGGSAHSAFEPLLPNGAPLQLVPKPGSLKRGMNSVAEESIMKRSRTSSISSGSGGHTPRGTLGSGRNPIRSSYSSSQGFGQWKKASAPSSPLSSPGSSRSQTPERASKKPREEDGQSPSSLSSVRSDQTASDKAPITSILTPVPKVSVTTSSDSTGSGGKRKRKIQLVSSHRGDHISLPPPPELGYTITVKDLDQQKKAALSKIQKVLEEPAPEPEKPGSSPATTSSQLASSINSTTTLSSLLAAPLPTASSSAIPVINLDPSPASSVNTLTSASNPLLEALRMKSNTPASSTSAATTTAVSTSTTPVEPSGSTLKPSTTFDAPQLPPTSLSQSTSKGVNQPSAFTQVLGQATKAPSSTPTVAGASLFGLASQLSTPTASSACNPAGATIPSATSTESASSANHLLASGFKPIFVATTTSSATSGPENKTAVPTFKPIFGSTTASTGFGQPPSLIATTSAPKASSTSTSSIFGGLTSSSTVAPSLFTGLANIPAGTTKSTSATTTTDPAAQPAGKSLFGNWSTPSTTSTSSTSAPAPATGSTFQFGAATTTTVAPAAPTAATTTSSNGTFTFGATMSANTPLAPPPATQKVFGFGQAATIQNPTTASFGGFALANTTATTATAASTTQSTFTFGKSSFEASAAPSAFSSPAAPLKPFTFGSSGASSTPVSAPTPAPFTFGAAAATTAPSFGTPVKPAFGTSSTSFAFGSTTTPSAAPPSFGAATQTQSVSSANFTFGSTAPQQTPSGPAQPASSGFNFSAAISGTQFGTPVSNNPAPQMAGFSFGAAATDKPVFGTSTPTFGQSAAAGPIRFGSPGTPVQGFNTVVPASFGSPATPSFSIGAGSKPLGARQRLQARRQHTRKK